MTIVINAWRYGRFIETQSNLRRKTLHRMNQSSNFPGGSLSIRDNVRSPIQFRRENQSNKSFLKCLNYFISFLKSIYAKFLDDLLAVVNRQFPLIDHLVFSFCFPHVRLNLFQIFVFLKVEN